MKRFKILSACLLALPFFSCSEVKTEDGVEAKVEELLARMTLQEKIGQMNQLSPGSADEVAALVKEGKVGSMLNVIDPEQVNKIQNIAVKESRLGIPVLML